MKKTIRRKTDRKWCAPEHRNAGSSWKGDKLMTSNFVKRRKNKLATKKDGEKKFRDSVFVIRLPKYVEEFYMRNGGLRYPQDAVIIREQNSDSPYNCYHEEDFHGGFINDNHMNAVTMDGRKEYR